MNVVTADLARNRAAWAGWVSGCVPGKPVEVLSSQQGRAGLKAYLREVVARTAAVARGIG